MKIACFDCPSGISGNMILGALLDTGLDKDYLNKELLKILNPKSEIRNKFQIRITKIKKHGLSGTHVEVKPKKEKTSRNLKNILAIINKSRLSKQVKFLSSRIFKRLAEAEAKVHGIPVNEVHFHEVGAVDAIIDIVGACIGIEKLGIERIYCSPLPNGRGRIVHAHGLLPNPAPAAAELLKGVPTYSTGIKGELVTPTGAAIITTLADSFGDLPRMKVESIGYGAGTINLPIPNLLRIFIGEAQIPAERDAVLQIETNIDDMDPKLYDRAIAGIMKAGALDASVQPIRMKKFRDAVKLVVLCRPEDKDKILDAVFTETTTIGVRIYLVQREKLRREIRAGKKISYLGPQIKRIKSE
jgi:hypothetical protein